MLPAIYFIRALLPARDARKPIEERLFEISLFLTVITLLLWSVVGVFSGYGWPIQSLYTFSLFFYCVLYYAVKKGKSFSVTTGIYYVTALLMIAVGWLPSGGIRGAVMHMCVLVYISGLLVLPLRSYVVFIMATVCVVVSFAIIEYVYPGLAVTYTDFFSFWRDLYIAGVLMLSMMGAAFYVFKKEYIRDRIELQKTIAELATSREKAVSADKAKSQFLATISHEMRTPLNGITGLSELISRTKLTAEQEELVRDLRISAKALSGIISDVLDITMIENKKLVLEEAVFELQEAVTDIGEVLKQEISRKKNFSLKYNYLPNQPVYVSGDLKRIRRVLLNLLSNAIKFTKEGTVTLTTDLSRRDEQQAVVLFSVEDTGIGIPKDLQKDVFKRFFKATPGIEKEGTGLGLSISKSLTELMGGRIWFTSMESVGSSFYFEVPLKLAKRPATIDQAATPDTKNFAELKVLVAEDVHINRIVALKMLKMLGIRQIEVVENGVDAVQKATSSAFDFILMDVLMPKMDGIAATKEIISTFTERNEKPPVIIALTANALKEDEEACKNAGMQDFVTKPFTSETLARVFEKHLQPT